MCTMLVRGLTAALCGVPLLLLCDLESGCGLATLALFFLLNLLPRSSGPLSFGPNPSRPTLLVLAVLPVSSLYADSNT